MYLYGMPGCQNCAQMRQRIGKTWLQCQYVDVSQNPGIYEGDVPALELEDGRILVGTPQINQYLARQGL